jgi:elongation factor G
VLDGAVAVFCGVAGVQPQSETVWRQAMKYGVPRIAFVNKMDRTGRELSRTRSMTCAPSWQPMPGQVLIPLGAEDQLKGQLDVVNKKAIIYSDSDAVGSTYTVEEIPAELVDLVDQAYADLVEQVANLDDEVGTAYLEEKPITPEMLKSGIRRQTIANKFVPGRWWFGLQEQRRSLFDRRSNRLPARPLGYSAGTRPGPRYG